jgi:hypothetical protein
VEAASLEPAADLVIGDQLGLSGLVGTVELRELLGRPPRVAAEVAVVASGGARSQRPDQPESLLHQRAGRGIRTLTGGCPNGF